MHGPCPSLYVLVDTVGELLVAVALCEDPSTANQVIEACSGHLREESKRKRRGKVGECLDALTQYLGGRCVVVTVPRRGCDAQAVATAILEGVELQHKPGYLCVVHEPSEGCALELVKALVGQMRDAWRLNESDVRREHEKVKLGIAEVLGRLKEPKLAEKYRGYLPKLRDVDIKQVRLESAGRKA